MASTPYVVRHKAPAQDYGDPSQNGPPFGIEATFLDRAEAEAFHRRREEEEAEKGNRGPLWWLLCFEGGDALLALSDFEPGLFNDWLSDHDIPDPDTIWEEYAGQQDPAAAYLDNLGQDKLRDLLAALHRFRYFEVVEVPLVVGDYPPERREAWERNLPPGPPTSPAGFDAAAHQAMLQQTLAQITEIFGDGNVPPLAPDDDEIPF